MDSSAQGPAPHHRQATRLCALAGHQVVGQANLSGTPRGRHVAGTANLFHSEDSMKYSELLQAYFDRSTALQWYWTIYIIVIGGVLAFSSFRQHKDVLVTILVTALYACFAYKNLGAIEATIVERQAILGHIKAFPT